MEGVRESRGKTGSGKVWQKEACRKRAASSTSANSASLLAAVWSMVSFIQRSQEGSGCSQSIFASIFWDLHLGVPTECYEAADVLKGPKPRNRSKIGQK